LIFDAGFRTIGLWPAIFEGRFIAVAEDALGRFKNSLTWRADFGEGWIAEDDLSNLPLDTS
jgi:hypothetical protein